MTARQVFEGLLIELNKVNAPSILLLDFNYFLNKAIRLYINKRYNIYDISQQTSDDLRVLKSTATIEVTKVTRDFDTIYEAVMPLDYLHLLNCICIFKAKKNFRCYKAGDYTTFPAKRMTADSESIIINDYYNRPTPLRPYFYINNVNISNTLPTNPITEGNPNGTDLNSLYIVSPIEIEYYLIKEIDSVKAGTRVYVNDGEIYTENTFITKIEGATMDDLSTRIVQGQSNNSNFPRTIKLGSPDFREVSTVEKEIAVRYGNASNIRIEIRCGSDDNIFELQKVLVDYLKSPQTIILTLEQINLTLDTSLIMEFPDYVCQEIINELTMLVMESASDPRLQTNSIVTQSIANPAQQLTL